MGPRQPDDVRVQLRGALNEIEDVSGDTLEPQSYSPSAGQAVCPASDTCTAWASSASGRELVLAAQLLRTAHSGVRPQQRRDSCQRRELCRLGHRLHLGSGQTPDLCTATDPGGVVTSYTYDSANPTQSLDYDVLTETAPGEAAETVNVYNSSGQVIQQTDPSGAVTTFQYNGNNAASGWTVVTIYPEGTGSGNPTEVTEYDYSNDVLIAEMTGGSSSSPLYEYFNRDRASLLDNSTEDADTDTTSNTLQTYSSSGRPRPPRTCSPHTDGAVHDTVRLQLRQPGLRVDAADSANGTTCPSISPPIPSVHAVSGHDDQRPEHLRPARRGHRPARKYNGRPVHLRCERRSERARVLLGRPRQLQERSGLPFVHVRARDRDDGEHIRLGRRRDDHDRSRRPHDLLCLRGRRVPEPRLVRDGPNGHEDVVDLRRGGYVLSKTVSFASYSATTQYSYDGSERPVCEVDPDEYAKAFAARRRRSRRRRRDTTPISGRRSRPTTTTGARSRSPTRSGISYTAHDQAGELYGPWPPTRRPKASVVPPSRSRRRLPAVTATWGDDHQL